MGSNGDDELSRRRARLGGLVATTAGSGSAARLHRLCAVALGEVGVDGGAVVVMSTIPESIAGHRTIVGSAGDLAESLEGLQLTTGEGPCLDAYASAAPVLAADLESEQDRWPGFAPEAAEAGARAVFSFPLQIGVARLGTFDLYRRRPGSMGRSELANALVLGELATETLLDGADDPSFGWLPDVHAVVHQASGMTAARCGVPLEEALVRVRAHAFADGVPIDEVARRIVSRDLVLDEPPDDAGPPV